MGGFRRFVLFVFALAGIVCLAALAIQWFGLLDVESLLGDAYSGYVAAVNVCLGMTAAWLVFELGRALFSGRSDAVLVTSIDGGEISVTKRAVASQASRIVEAAHIGVARSVDVRAGKRGPVRVRVKIAPCAPVDVTRVAPKLHDQLVSGLSAMCGDCLGPVSVEFLEAQQADSAALTQEADYGDETPADSNPDERDVSATAYDSGDITVPLHSEGEE